MKTIYFLLFNDFHLLDFTGSLQVFQSANKIHGSEFYRVILISNSHQPVTSHFGITLETNYLPETMEDADTLIVCGGSGAHEASKDTNLTAWFKRNELNFNRVVSICSGTFLLAEWGVLEGKKAVTHWVSCDLLRRKYPKVKVMDDKIFINDGKIWTSAGVTSGIDLTLAIVEEDIDHLTSLNVAKDLVVYLRRDGGQNQFSDMLKIQYGDKKISEIIGWIQKNIKRDIRVTDLALVVNTSERNINRLFQANVGQPPLQFVQKIRLELAKKMLDNSDKAMAKIVLDCGFKNDLSFRRLFIKAYKVTPYQYRKKFGLTKV